MGNMDFYRKYYLDRKTVSIAAAGLSISLACALGILGYQVHESLLSGADDTQNPMNAIAQSVSREIDTENPVSIQTQGDFDLATCDMASIPETDTICHFSLVLPNILIEPDNNLDLAELDSALTALRDCDDGDLPNTTAFVFINAENGNAISYNAGLLMYPASSIKAMFCYYVLSARIAEVDEYDRQLIEDAILYSDNASYTELVYKYTNEDTIAWFANYGIDYSGYTDDSYPMLSAKSAIKLWRDILLYIDAGSDDAIWFGDILSNTSVSFARDATTGRIGEAMLETGDIVSLDANFPEIEPNGVTVWNKAGWIVDWEVNGLADSGIIRDTDGTRYIFSFMTDAAESEPTILAFENLLQSTWNTRSILS